MINSNLLRKLFIPLGIYATIHNWFVISSIHDLEVGLQETKPQSKARFYYHQVFFGLPLEIKYGLVFGCSKPYLQTIFFPPFLAEYRR